MRRLVTVVVVLAGCFNKPGFEVPPDADCAKVTPDEDGDCVTDADDNCPGIANSDQLNLDSDTVGDACDPNPQLDGDRINNFEGFNDALTEMSTWQFETGDWVSMPGYVENTTFSTMSSTFELLENRAEVRSRGLTVEVGFEHVAFDQTAATSNMGIYVDNLIGNLFGHHCSVHHVRDVNNREMFELQERYMEQTVQRTVQSSPTAPLTAGDRFVVRLTRQDGATSATDHIGCMAVSQNAVVGGFQPIERGGATWPAAPLGRIIKIGGDYSKTRVHWITVYTTTATLD